MKRLICLAFVVLLTACTPTQLARYWAAKAEGGEVAAQADAAAQEYLAVKAQATAGRPCAEWYDYAIEAGFTPEQWMEPISRIMYRESHCIPTADNPTSSALGLMQHLRFWAERCGIPYETLVDPATSLRCAFVTYQQQGWGAWATW